MRIFRLKQLCGPNGLFGIGHSKLYEHYIEREGADPFIPGTHVRRARTVNLGERAKGMTDVEVDRIIRELAAEAKPLPAAVKMPLARPRGRPRKGAKAAGAISGG